MRGDAVHSDDIPRTHCSKKVPTIVEAAQVALLHHEVCNELQVRPEQHFVAFKQYCGDCTF